MKNNLFVFIIIFCLSVFSHAGGNGTGNGGDVIICKYSKTENEVAYLADTYNEFKDPTLRSWAFRERLKHIPYKKILDVIFEQVPSVAAQNLEFYYRQLQVEFVSGLSELEDDHIQIEDPRCYKKQLAIQYFDPNHVGPTGKLSIHLQRFIALSGLERALFFLHEARIRKFHVEQGKLLDTTFDLRDLVFHLSEVELPSLPTSPDFASIDGFSGLDRESRNDGLNTLLVESFLNTFKFPAKTSRIISSCQISIAVPDSADSYSDGKIWILEWVDRSFDRANKNPSTWDMKFHQLTLDRNLRPIKGVQGQNYVPGRILIPFTGADEEMALSLVEFDYRSFICH